MCHSLKAERGAAARHDTCNKWLDRNRQYPPQPHITDKTGSSSTEPENGTAKSQTGHTTEPPRAVCTGMGLETGRGGGLGPLPKLLALHADCTEA